MNIGISNLEFLPQIFFAPSTEAISTLLVLFGCYYFKPIHMCIWFKILGLIVKLPSEIAHKMDLNVIVYDNEFVSEKLISGKLSRAIKGIFYWLNRNTF